MSRFISGSVNWLRRSFSEHDGGLNSNSRNDSNSANSNNNNNGKCEKLKRFANSFDVENLLLEDSSTPNLIGGPSHVLTDVNLLIPLSNYFPSRILGADWILNFSTAQDGFSLGSLYRRLAQGRVDSPALLAILDTEGTCLWCSRLGTISSARGLLWYRSEFFIPFEAGFPSLALEYR
ncbi:TLD domain-containing protein 2 isoform X2 [Lepeophtheirus salmonis]|uniref:TLD domain-containing protein 2 isoform X2 n=1 Tax=Lepeophtheirus salmonis TaxID=72036 RepID=UPI003AF3A230